MFRTLAAAVAVSIGAAAGTTMLLEQRKAPLPFEHTHTPTTFKNAELAETSIEAARTALPPMDSLAVEEAVITQAPFVPPAPLRKEAKRLIVRMESVVKTIKVSPTQKYEAWTFNGAIPGPFIRARRGDVIEVHHKNTDAISHNIDFHAVTGPGGGGPCLLAEKEEEKVGHFRLLQPGLFVYHCAAAPVPAHVANGMYGLLMVDPEDGLPPVDREFFVVQSEIYADPATDDPNLLEYNHEAGLREQPLKVVFNGREGALTEAPLVCKQGERVRIFVGNAGPNLVSSFHVIGSVFDKVYREGDVITPPAKGVGVSLVPAGGTSIIEFDAVVPGNYTIVDHSIFRIEKGAIGFIKVIGDDPRQDLYASNAMPIPCPGCKLHN